MLTTIEREICSNICQDRLEGRGCAVCLSACDVTSARERWLLHLLFLHRRTSGFLPRPLSGTNVILYFQLFRCRLLVYLMFSLINNPLDIMLSFITGKIVLVQKYNDPRLLKNNNVFRFWHMKIFSLISTKQTEEMFVNRFLLSHYWLFFDFFPVLVKGTRLFYFDMIF